MDPSKFVNPAPSYETITNNRSGDIIVNSPLVVVEGNADAGTVQDLNSLMYDLLHDREFT